ncbi:MAG: argininosuccinate lyase [Planctomycetes bacterium]|nr:argininosuccinate lyase [Planctomycetota bacterium]MCB9913002.1 argininosuccinate lyase [Planctomycetota bacterium]HPF15591.1 argininosuccinate lyase [Planctomycetota bacterium]HRV81485.1 argininosuccinate lyase [Planctomycetota bacterium]
MTRLWDKGEPLDELILRFTVGDDYRLDERLVAYDVRASCAHVRMLQEGGYLFAADADALCSTLEAIGAEHAAGEWSIAREEEDCHTALERRLIDRLGDTGGRIHLGRSRNDQVLAALRLYLLDALETLCATGAELIGALQQLAQEQGAIPLPGYTHMQRAMPSSVRDWALAFAAELEDGCLGLRASRRRISKNPLGSAAGYGVPVLALDRAVTGRLLGFDVQQEPVTAVQLSRGKAEATVVFELALLLQDAGRLAADLCLFATQEFAFVQLPAGFTTGSSIMPQKRNPDVFELIRARSTQLPAELQAILAITAKMTSGYHRDLQLIKEPLFRAIDQGHDTLRVLAHAIPGIRFDSERTTQAMDPSLFAAERAYRLVQEEGIPFREAYQRVARNKP